MISICLVASVTAARPITLENKGNGKVRSFCMISPSFASFLLYILYLGGYVGQSIRFYRVNSCLHLIIRCFFVTIWAKERMMFMEVLQHASPVRPLALSVYDALVSRFLFSDEDRANHHRLRRGFRGELEFSKVLQAASPSESLLLHSLSLKSNNSKFQIDSLLLNNQTVYLFEVKNFAGDYYIQKNNWYAGNSDREITNPFIQLKRCESLLRQLLSSFNVTYKIVPYVVFIHPEFTLYNASRNLPLIFHSQLRRFFHRDFFQPFPYSETDYEIAQILTQEHKEDLRLEQLPDYSFEAMKKGVKCEECENFMEVGTKQSLFCRTCRLFEKNEEAILRSIKEFVILFPRKRITTRKITHWCQHFSESTIQRVLRKNYQKAGAGRTIYYLTKDL